jgi:hypothetical protein
MILYGQKDSKLFLTQAFDNSINENRRELVRMNIGAFMSWKNFESLTRSK